MTGTHEDLKRQVFLAHVRASDDGPHLPHRMEDHLRDVAALAESFGREFGAADWARIAGLWHDLGKYRPAFQRYIRRETGYDDGEFGNASLARTEHAIVGAIHAMKRLPPGAGRVLAYLIAGHHAGLTDWLTAEAGRASLKVRLSEGEPLYDEIRPNRVAEEILHATQPTSSPPSRDAFALWIRMLFSCLVDADFLDTERFLEHERTRAREGFASLTELKGEFDSYMDKLELSAREDAGLSRVNRIRSDILRVCRERAAWPPGLFSLTVPTGGGKTLASMAFALEHALRYGKRRIIYVIPYTSIIEQTADVFRRAFDPLSDAVVEHHSNVDFEADKDEVLGRSYLKSRLATENWDAPIVVTTAVQFFESLFAARPSRVRKLHNIVNSVVVLDEAQLLPPDFLKPILETLQQLSDHFSVSTLLMTATQPALNQRSESDLDFPGLSGVREIVDDPMELHRVLKRTKVELPTDLHSPRDWESIAEELLTHKTALCIVDNRRDCQTLWRLLHTEDPEAIHLSALMCGAHRAKVIATIRERLAQRIPTRVVSTQLIEAGVDVDFPVVYRALAGLDSIAQAAGRCNREGQLRESDGEPIPGTMVVFVPPKPAPPGYLRMAQDCGRQLLAEDVEDPLAPERFTRFFEELYWKYGRNLDRHGILDDLKNRPKLDFRFRTAAAKFRIIDDTQQATVIVRYGEDADDLIQRLRHTGPSRTLLRRLQRRMVNVPRWYLGRMLHSGVVSEIHPGIFVQADTSAYDENTGLIIEFDEVRNPAALTI